uniref:Uncharacterized protein n=1 Tax=Glossina pallidipes TaxID=7398 RepID=A0A1A9ZIR4_GLOPL
MTLIKAKSEFINFKSLLHVLLIFMNHFNRNSPFMPPSTANDDESNENILGEGQTNILAFYCKCRSGNTASMAGTAGFAAISSCCLIRWPRWESSFQSSFNSILC